MPQPHDTDGPSPLPLLPPTPAPSAAGRAALTVAVATTLLAAGSLAASPAAAALHAAAPAVPGLQPAVSRGGLTGGPPAPALSSGFQTRPVPPVGGSPAAPRSLARQRWVQYTSRIALAVMSAMLVVAGLTLQRLLAINQRIALAATTGSTTETDPEQPQQMVCPDCPKCGGTGRIQGGIAALPYPFSLWPIKVYRPCPNFKGEYKRAGPTLDDLASGGIKKLVVRDGTVKPIPAKLNLRLDDEEEGARPSAPSGAPQADDPVVAMKPKGFGGPKKK